jgi:hypothetical protein
MPLDKRLQGDAEGLSHASVTRCGYGSDAENLAAQRVLIRDAGGA